MSYLVSDLQLEMALMLGETSAADPSTDEFAQRLAYANRAYIDWSQRYRWNKLKVSDDTITTTSSLNYVLLPSNFDENSITGIVQVNGSTYTLLPIDKRLFYPSSAQICWVEYDSTLDQYKLVFNTAFDNTYVVKLNYSIRPATLISDSSKIIVQNPYWLVRQAVGYLYMDSQDSELSAYGTNILQLNEQLYEEMKEKDQRNNPATTFEALNTFDLIGVGHGVA